MTNIAKKCKNICVCRKKVLTLRGICEIAHKTHNIMKKHLLLALMLLMAFGAKAAKECYTVYDAEKHTLTYYYDDQLSSRKGIIDRYDPEHFEEKDRFVGYAADVEVAVLDESMHNYDLTSTECLFVGYNTGSATYCYLSQMTEIRNLTYLTTSKVINMSNMFRYCQSLKSLDLRNFNTANVANTSCMFAGCYALTELDLTSFDIRKMDFTRSMFYNCPELTTIYSNTDWTKYIKNDKNGVYHYNGFLVSGNTSFMFDGCKKLKGGKGTAYDSSKTDLTNARPDGTNDDDEEGTGYFTRKKNVYTRYRDGHLTYFYNIYRWSDERAGYITEAYSPENNPYFAHFDGYAEEITEAVIAPDMKDAKLTSTLNMFHACKSISTYNHTLKNLETITGMEYLNTEKVTNMNNMFYYCSKLKEIDLSHFNTAKVTKMAGMFTYCSSLKTLDLRTFNMDNVTYVRSMFAECSELVTIFCSEDLSRIEESTIFKGCTKLLGGQGTTCDGINNIGSQYARPDGGIGDPGYFTDNKEIYTTFKDGVLTYYYDGKRTFYEGQGLKTEVYDASATERCKGYNEQVKKAVIDVSMSQAPMTSAAYMFYNLTQMTTVEGLENLNTADVETMSCMFRDCMSLTSLDINSLNMSKVEYVHDMFHGCKHLKTIYCNEDWSKLDGLKGWTDLFLGCEDLEGSYGTEYNEGYITRTYAHPDGGALKPGYFTAAKQIYTVYKDGVLTYHYDAGRTNADGIVELYNPEYIRFKNYHNDIQKVIILPNMQDAPLTTTSAMFYGRMKKGNVYGLENLKTIEGMEYLNTKDVTDMSMMFCHCESLESIDLSHLRTDKVEYMDFMFSYCQSLKEIDLSQFNVMKVKNLSYMFSRCTNLKTSYCLGDWSMAPDLIWSDGMFYQCEKLEGGIGTKYDKENANDISYAHTDGETGTPGYFTRGKTIYTAYKDGVLHYHYDSQAFMYFADGYDVQLYDPISYPNAIRFKGYNNEVEKVQIHESMKEVWPTTLESLFYGGKDEKETYNLGNLKTIVGLRNLNTGLVESMYKMFYGCTSLESVDISSFVTAGVKDMSWMFVGCEALKEVNMNGLYIDGVEDMSYMFFDCKNLETIYCNDDWTDAASVKNSECMFSYCTKLKGHKGTAFDENHKDLSYARLDGYGSQPGYFSAQKEVYTVYDPSSKILTYYYDAGRIAFGGEKYDPHADRFVGYNEDVLYVFIDKSMKEAPLTTTVRMFCGRDNANNTYLPLTNAQYISGLEYLNTLEVTDMKYMFYGMASVTTLNVRNFNVGKVAWMDCMFAGCSSLHTIYCQHSWNRNKPNSWQMFGGCVKLQGGQGTKCNGEDNVNADYAVADGLAGLQGYFTAENELYTSFNEDGVLHYYFDRQRGAHEQYEGAITEIYDPDNLGLIRFETEDGFNYSEYVTSVVVDKSLAIISNFTSLRNMFYGGAGHTLKNAVSIKGLENIDTKYVENMSFMFAGMESLERVDISSFKTNALKNTERMFMGCTKLNAIYCDGNWSSLTNITTSTEMFKNCPALAGHMGTKYSSENPTDKTYAHSDGGAGNPGYFSSSPEIYVELVGDVLTYYYDSYRAARTGTTALYDPNDPQPYGAIAAEAVHAVIDGSMWWVVPDTWSFLFGGLQGLEDITGMEYLDMSNVINLRGMFSECWMLKSVDLSSFYTANVWTMEAMFSGCASLTELNLSNFDVDKLQNTDYMFEGCGSLTTIYWNEDLSGNTKIYTSKDMFKGCKKLKGSMGTAAESYPTTTDKTFACPDASASLGFFTGVDELYTVYKDHELTYYYDGQRCYRDGVVEKPNSRTRFEGYAKDVEMIIIDMSLKRFHPTSMYGFFRGWSNSISHDNLLSNAKTIIGLDYLQTEDVGDMGYMFYGLASLTSVDLRSLNLNSLAYTDGMFYGCENLTTIYCNKDLSNMNQNILAPRRTAKAPQEISVVITKIQIQFAPMFGECYSLVGCAGSRWDMNREDESYAHPDGGYSNPGYFTSYYKVTLKAEHGQIIMDQDVNLSKVPSGTYISLKAEPDAGYMFDSWDNYDPSTGLIVMANTTVTANFKARTYTVRFYDWDGTLLATREVNSGNDATAPEDPSRKGYTFTGWDTDFSNVRRNLTVYALYSIKTFTVRFLDYDDEVLSKQTVEYGCAATAPEDPSRKGYTFTGWDAEFDNVTSNMDIHATYKKKADEGIEAVADDSETTKIIRNGQLFIIRGGKVYNAFGVVVR